MFLNCSSYRLLFVCLMLAGAGCATPPANSGHGSFSGYAESVFRHQNELSSRLLMLSEADQLPDDDEFENAEEAMRIACHPLNDYAERESGGESMSWRFKSKVQASVRSCDDSVQKLEALLARPVVKP